MQSVPITTNVVSSNPTHGKVYLIQHYVINLQVSSTNKTNRNYITEIFLKVALNTQTLYSIISTLQSSIPTSHNNPRHHHIIENRKIPGAGMGRTQEYGGIKPVNVISSPFLIIGYQTFLRIAYKDICMRNSKRVLHCV